MAVAGARPGRIPVIPDTRAFLHVIDAYRALAEAAEVWDRMDPHAGGDDLEFANRRFPNLRAMAQDTMLARARSLIEFYVSRHPRADDIVIDDFSLRLQRNQSNLLAGRNDSISVHLLHLTAWRDTAYRRAQRGARGGNTRQRPDLVKFNPKLVRWLLDSLTKVFPVTGPSRARGVAWQEVFADLHSACERRVDDHTNGWPLDFTTKRLRIYLRSKGLA